MALIIIIIQHQTVKEFWQLNLPKEYGSGLEKDMI